MRKLVTLRTVNNITPIEGADKIVSASIDGWNCIVKANEFKIGDVGVFFEVDSLIPLTDEFAFLKDKARKNHGGIIFNDLRIRIKTIRLKGVLSQGLLLPISLFKDRIDFSAYDFESDLTEAFNVLKYEPKVLARLRGNAKGLFPSFIFKTDQERVQNLPKVYSMSIEKGLDYEVTLKMNGASMTVFYQTVTGNNDNGVCSRNYQLELNQENNHYCDIQKRDHIIERLIEYHAKTGKSYAVQGELVGVDIQKNYEQFDTLQFFVFDVFDIEEGKYLFPEERRKVVAELGLKHVPVIEEHFSLSTFNENTFMDEILKYADGKSINAPVREGVVFKSNQPHHGLSYSFKAISNIYLEKHDTD